MKKLPLIPTLIVAVAVGLMIWLGIWQLQRKGVKEALLATYAEASAKPSIAFPTQPNKQDESTYLFRHSSGYCALVTGWSAESGGPSGTWKHVASCFTGDPSAAMMLVDVGADDHKEDPKWQGGQVDGVITQDNTHVFRLIATEPAPGLKASMLPKIEDVPNNHLGYALTWFAFAALALIIYALALRRRND